MGIDDKTREVINEVRKQPRSEHQKISSEVKLARTLNKNEITMVLSGLGRLSVDELNKYLKDNTQPSMHMLLARILATAMIDGDEKKAKFLVEFLFGPMTQKIDLELSGTVNMHKYVCDYIQTLEEAKKGGQNGEKSKKNKVKKEIQLKENPS